MDIIPKIPKETIQAIRQCLKTYMDMTLQPAKNREKNHYRCPFCDNGRALSYDPKDGGEFWKCHLCGQKGDIVTLYALQNNLHYKRDFVQICAALAKLLNVPFDIPTPDPDAQQYQQDRPAVSAPPMPTAPAEAGPDAGAAAAAEANRKEKADYIARCAAALQSEAGQPGLQYLLGRGITKATATAFKLGYDCNRCSITLPDSEGGCQARSIDPNRSNRYYYPKGGPAGVLTCLQDTADPTVPRVIWITEGEFDALSIWQAGSSAISVNGAGNVKKLSAALAAITTDPDALQPILWLDNDREGIKRSKEARGLLKGAGYHVLTYLPDTAGKMDPNDILQQQGQAKLQDIVLHPGKVTKYRRYSAAAALAAADAALKDGRLTRCYPTGLPRLDALLDGGLYGGLYTIGAISSAGKTTLCLQIGDYIASQGQDVLIISQEMQAAELVLKSISRITYQIGRPCSYREIIHNGGRPDASIDTARAAYMQRIAPWLYIREGISDTSAAAVETYIKEHERITGRAPVVIIDYLQALAPADPRMTDKQAIDNAVLTLKRCARDHKTPILAISSLNRASYQREISFEGFKEAGSIEYGSDVVLGLQYEGQGLQGFSLAAAQEAAPRSLLLRVLKNRFGRQDHTGISLLFHSAYNVFQEAAPTEAQRSTGKRIVF